MSQNREKKNDKRLHVAFNVVFATGNKKDTSVNFTKL
jgi:hypothetical protein